MFKFEVGQSVVTCRGLQAFIVEKTIGDNLIGPIGINCYLCQENSRVGEDGLSWQIEPDLK